jgi:hypothetical protein
MMTSFRWWPPLCPNTDSVQLHSIDSLRLLACLALLGVVQMTRQNDTSLLELGFGRSQDSLPTPTSLPCQSQFLDGGRLLATLSRRMPHDIQSLLSDCSFVSTFRQPHQLHSVLLSCMLFLFYRRSFADVTSLLQMHNSILRFADVQHPPAATRLPSNFS